MAIETPSLQITIGNDAIQGAAFFELGSAAYFSADRFELGLAICAGGVSSIGYFAGLGASTIMIDGVLNGGAANLITGQIDNISIDFLRNVAVLSGRDLSARLIDMEISQTFINQTASQIAQELAQATGLSPNVTATTTPIGQYYELDHTRSVLGLHSRTMTAWNLLVSLAQIEGFVVRVVGTTLFFGPMAPAVPIALTPANMLALDIDMATTLPGSVTVKSWNCRAKTANTQTAGSGNATTMIRPNLSSMQATMLAENHLATLGQHTTILHAEMPGDLTTMPMMQFALSGTLSPLDQIYTIDFVRRSMSARHGFVQTVRAYAQSA